MRFLNTAAAFLMAFSFTSAAVQASDKVGVFALYSAEKGVSQSAFDNTGCSLTRQGAIVARQGNLDLPDANRFVLLNCNGPQLSGGGAKGLLANLEAPLILEGGLEFFEEPVKSDEVKNRQYLLKVAYYNNKDINARDADLKAIGNIVEPLEDRYHNELFIDVHRASGVRTPDEVVAIYYDTPENGSRFRENNQEILEMVGAFNMKHLVSFTYLVAKPD
ncbi:hypothetical protein [Labrenzia sp. PHM005]|uniref:hypothetical protein n=1 Tax=Labrenzia sp. PHM005 TaxID=2590016 RepID=UPI0011400732|nr:hypothetical protein [Labrenzia sp. PHM005]QDG76518.1 hypothetical protein FJ695_11910 [Labrenzia sp. PHM005]